MPNLNKVPHGFNAPREFPTVIDASMRSGFVDCPTAFMWSNIVRIRPSAGSIHLVAGGAFAAGMHALRTAYYEQGLNLDNSMVEATRALLQTYGTFDPKDHAKSPEGMVGAMEAYLEAWPFDESSLTPYVLPSGQIASEVSFAIPLPVLHPQTGDPIIYAGRLDWVGVDPYGQLWIVDEKTTTQLGEQWSKQWTLRGQFLGYKWAARELGLPPLAGVVVRGVAILKTLYRTADSVLQSPDWMVDRWHAQMLHDVKEMRRYYDEGFWPQAFGSACTAYGGCGYMPLCTTNDPAAWESTYYAENTWHPLTFVHR